MADTPGFLTPQQLVERWGGQITLATLATWRSRSNGPAFVKIGGRVLYRLADVEAYERRNTRGNRVAMLAGALVMIFAEWGAILPT